MKTIASDFDNTLYVKNKSDLEKNIEVVKTFIQKGNKFIIITGRSFPNISKVIKENNISYSCLVCQDGANIFDENNNCIHSTILNRDKALIMQEYLKKNNVLFTYESAFNDDDTIDNAVKITIDITPEMDAKKILSDIKNLVSIYGYLSSSHINILDSTVNKGNALEFLKQNNYIDDNIIVIGDDINDYEMLKKYNGVVMKKHDSTLNNLHKEEIESVHQYINKIR